MSFGDKMSNCFVSVIMTEWIWQEMSSIFSLGYIIRLHKPSVKKSHVQRKRVPIAATVYGKFHQSLVSKTTSLLSIMFVDSA